MEIKILIQKSPNSARGNDINEEKEEWKRQNAKRLKIKDVRD
jgi:hypothetical protein